MRGTAPRGISPSLLRRATFWTKHAGAYILASGLDFQLMQKAGRRVRGSRCPFRLSAINHLHAVRSCFWCLPSCPRTLQPSSAVRAVQERWDVKYVNATASASSHPYVLRSLQGKSTRDPLSSRVQNTKSGGKQRKRSFSVPKAWDVRAPIFGPSNGIETPHHNL